MPKRLVEFPTEDGGHIIIQVDEPAAGAVTRGLRRDREAVAERAHQTFEQATRTVTPAAQSLLGHFRGLAQQPDEIVLEFGVQLSAEAGAFVASVAAEANFKVSLCWKKA